MSLMSCCETWSVFGHPGGTYTTYINVYIHTNTKTCQTVFFFEKLRTVACRPDREQTCRAVILNITIGRKRLMLIVVFSAACCSRPYAAVGKRSVTYFSKIPHALIKSSPACVYAWICMYVVKTYTHAMYVCINVCMYHNVAQKFIGQPPSGGPSQQ